MLEYTLYHPCHILFVLDVLDTLSVCVVASEPSSRVVTPLLSATASIQSVDMAYYNKLLSHIPEDRTTVELILHCMVEQVCLLIR